MANLMKETSTKMGRRKLKIKTKAIGIRVSERVALRLEKDADEREITVGALLRQIVDDHYSLNERRTMKEINRQAENLLPDFKRQKKALALMIDKLEEYREQSAITEDYVAEMKSAESFNMKLSREYFEGIIHRLDQMNSKNPDYNPKMKKKFEKTEDVSDIKLEDIKKTLLGHKDDEVDGLKEKIAEKEIGKSTPEDLFSELTK